MPDGVEKEKSKKMEQWKKIIIEGQPTCYSVSDMGRVRNDKKNTYLEGYIANNGYRMVHLRYRIDKMCSVHRLVMKAFCPIPEMDDLQINHKDGNKLNNNLDNLEWSTALENMRHSFRKGLQPRQLRPCYAYDLKGYYITAFESVADASRQLNIDDANIFRCLDGLQTHIHQYQFRDYKVPKIDEWSKPQNKKVYVYKDTGEFIKVYNSQKECAQDFGVADSSISRFVKGTRKLEGFVFSRIPL